MSAKKRTVLFLVVCVLLCAASLSAALVYAKKTRGFCKVYGTVSYDAYTGGTVFVYWRKELGLGDPVPKNKPVRIKQIPGAYSKYIPMDVGSFYVCAKCTGMNSKIESTAYFVSDRIVMKPGQDTVRVDVRLTVRKMLMDSYAGPTVTVSGRVLCKNYRKGLIGVAVESPENHQKVYLPPDIALKLYAQPGDYAIQVPARSGKVYINALNYPEADAAVIAGDKPNVAVSRYEHNPVDVGSSDIGGVDIILPCP